MIRVLPLRNTLIASAVAVALALTGCGASPTAAPRTVKRTTTAAAATAPAAAKTATQQVVVAAPTYSQAASNSNTTAATTTTSVGASTKDGGTVLSSQTFTLPDPSKVSIESTDGGTTGGTDASSQLDAATAALLAAPALSAEIDAEKNGVLFGAGAYKCSVTVSNSADTAKTGMLEVTYMNGEKPSATPPSIQLVTVPAHGSLSFDFSDPKWTTDSAVVQVTETHAGQPLAAFVVAMKNGVLFGAGTYKCTVEVINPDDQPHTGTLHVAFFNKDKASVTPPLSQSITLQPHQSQSFDFSDPKWSTDNVHATIE